MSGSSRIPAARLGALVVPFAAELAVVLDITDQAVQLATPARQLIVRAERDPEPRKLDAPPAGRPVLVQRAALLRACRQLVVYQQRPDEQVQLSIIPDRLHLHAGHARSGRGRVDLAASAAGAPVRIWLRHNHLRQAVRRAGSVTEDLLVLKVTDARTPIWLGGLDPSGCRVQVAPLLPPT